MLTDRSWLRIVYLVARREFLARVRSRVFLIGTAVLVILVCGYIVLQAEVFSRSGTSFNVGFTGPAQGLAQPLVAEARALDFKVTVSSPASQSQGVDSVRSGDLDALVSGTPTNPTLTVKDQADPQLSAALNAVVRQAAFDEALLAHGVSPGVIGAQVAGAGVSVHPLDAGASERAARTVAGTIVAILLFVTLQIYGQVVAAGVVEEKSNRIVEIILSTLRARQLLLGKVLGIGSMGVIQLAIVGAAALLVASRTNVISVPAVGPSVVGGSLLWFVLGFLIYALLYAAAASLVSRQEDLGAVTSPLSFVLVGTYLTFFWAVNNPDSVAAIVISVLPVFAPVLMPARMATGDATVWQVVLAVALTAGAIVAISGIGARIYANSVLRTGARVSLRQAWTGRL
ncbi:MAG TPA: ABC transporter permease [Candidatus Dormibacteraeota bacterium]